MNDFFEFDVPAKFAIFIRLFSLPNNKLSKENPCVYYCGRTETDDNPSFEMITSFVEKDVPGDKKHLIKILDQDEMLEYSDFVPKWDKSRLKMTKLFRLTAMSYICVLRRY